MLIVMRGLPASGKTTLAKRLGHTRCNRDGIRLLLHGGFIGTDEAEREVSIAQTAAVEALLDARVTVVIDDCNLRDNALHYWRRVAESCHHQFIIYDLSDVDVEECVKRAAVRDKHEAREDVIRRMHANYFPLPKLDESLKRHIRSVPSPLSEGITMGDGQGYSGEHEIDADANGAAEVENADAATDSPAVEASTGVDAEQL